MSNMNKMPREEGLDQSVSFMREGYMYIGNRRRSFQTDVFETRLLGKKAICMGGKEAANIFYDNEKFQRQGAAPKRVRQTLFGEKGVQTLDGDLHKHRKSTFMSLMSSDRLDDLKHLAKSQWQRSISAWSNMEEIVLYEEVKEILCKVACQWAGVPIKEEDIKNKADDLSALFESAGSIGPNHWKGRMERNQLEKWIKEFIDQVRNETVNPPKNTALHIFAHHCELNGDLLPSEVAAVEVINMMRPIVAIAIYINFIALSLHQYPEEAEKLKSGDEKNIDMFIQEVRRFYPFFPAAIAKVKIDFSWNGYHFEQGTLTLLDLYGTNHDANLWDNPDIFHPSRFANRTKNLFDFIPQGGGDVDTGHRCPGEQITIDIMKISLDFLLNRIKWSIPKQDLSYSLVNMPSIPKSKIIMQNVSLI